MKNIKGLDTKMSIYYNENAVNGGRKWYTIIIEKQMKILM
jgi:hypothetical protein